MTQLSCLDSSVGRHSSAIKLAQTTNPNSPIKNIKKPANTIFFPIMSAIINNPIIDEIMQIKHKIQKITFLL